MNLIFYQPNSHHYIFQVTLLGKWIWAFIWTVDYNTLSSKLDYGAITGALIGYLWITSLIEQYKLTFLEDLIDFQELVSVEDFNVMLTVRKLIQ